MFRISSLLRSSRTFQRSVIENKNNGRYRSYGSSIPKQTETWNTFKILSNWKFGAGVFAAIGFGAIFLMNSTNADEKDKKKRCP